jgi:ATP-dependent Zn protease
VSELDEFLGTDSLIIGTTNQMGDVDKSMRRGGRFDIDIRMDMPDAEDRYAVFKSHLDYIGHDILVNDLRMISRATSGFVSSDLA